VSLPSKTRPERSLATPVGLRYTKKVRGKEVTRKRIGIIVGCVVLVLIVVAVLASLIGTGGNASIQNNSTSTVPKEAGK
jgi:hypothetical protein